MKFYLIEDAGFLRVLRAKDLADLIMILRHERTIATIKGEI